MTDNSKFVAQVAKDRVGQMSREELEVYALRLSNQTMNGKDSLVQITRTQERIQREEFGFDVDDYSLNELATKIMETKQHLDDEITEVLTALGGEYGKAAWKYWKADHKKTAMLKLDDLAEHEWEELCDEVADVMIFGLNIAIQCGVSGYALSESIRRKQEVNVERQRTGY